LAANAILSAISGQSRLWWESLLGTLGWLTVRLPRWVYIGLTASLVLLAIVGAFQHPLERGRASNTATPGQSREPAPTLLPLTWTIAAAGVIVLSCLLIIESQYLIWTPVGLGTVLGVTGRYFLPILPLAAFLVPQIPVQLRRALSNGAVSAVTLCLVVAEATVAVSFLFAYWLR
jgi:hypothetical protein